MRGLKRAEPGVRYRGCRSHPTWVRGLKQGTSNYDTMILWSHPTWVRGLKLPYLNRYAEEFEVAPYVGAWIETRPSAGAAVMSTVAPYVGAWIET